MPEDDKLWEAMEEDEELIQKTLGRLTDFSNKRVCIRIKNPANEHDVEEVHVRPLRQAELLEYNRRLKEINPKLGSAKGMNEVDLSDEETERVYDLMDEFIEKASKIPRKELKEKVSLRIRVALLMGIFKASAPDERELEDLRKFRDV